MSDREASALLTFRRLAPVLAVGALAFGYSQWVVMPRGTPWLAPALAAVGAIFVAWSFVDAVARYDRRRPRRVARVIVNVAMLIVFVLLPATRLFVLLRPSDRGGPRVLSGFRDWLGAEGYPRIEGLHSGVDVAGRAGADVLAAAGGRVVVARDNRNSCGLIVVVDHRIEDYRTIYCHLAEIAVKPGDDVARGMRIGAIGTSGMRAWPGYEHVHWELEKGRYGPREDPIARTVGCFQSTTSYATAGLVLTYPVRC